MIHEKLHYFRLQSFRAVVLSTVICLLCAATLLICLRNLHAQQQKIEWTPQQEAIIRKIRSLRQLPDKKRGQVTKQLALEIRQLPPSENKVRLAAGLASRSTEGDPGGRATVQVVATTLADALGEHPPAAGRSEV